MENRATSQEAFAIIPVEEGVAMFHMRTEEVSLLNGTVPQHFQLEVFVGERQSYQWKTARATIATDGLTE